MNRFVHGALVLAVLGFTASRVLALGCDYSKDYLKLHGEFVKGQTPVHGYFVNWEDVFFYAGDAKAFNRFVDAYSKFKHVKLKVVIHPGTKNASSPWDQAPRDLPVDWSLYVWDSGYPLLALGLSGKEAEIIPVGEPAPTRVDVWLSDKRLKLQDLRIPANIEVVAAKEVETGSEIKKYVLERKKGVK
jgi:hypothetical protein